MGTGTRLKARVWSKDVSVPKCPVGLRRKCFWDIRLGQLLVNSLVTEPYAPIPKLHMTPEFQISIYFSFPIQSSFLGVSKGKCYWINYCILNYAWLTALLASQRHLHILKRGTAICFASCIFPLQLKLLFWMFSDISIITHSCSSENKHRHLTCHLSALRKMKIPLLSQNCTCN